MYSAYKLNSRVTIYSLDVLLSSFEPSIVPCLVLTVASWPVHRFLRRQVMWSNIPISFRIFQFVLIHTVKGISILNEAEVDGFLKFPCFFYDPMDIGHLIPGSSAVSKSSLYIWKFLVYILLKASLKDFEHSFASVWNESNCAVVWNIFGIAFLWNWNSSSPVATAEFSKVAGILSAAL